MERPSAPRRRARARVRGRSDAAVRPRAIDPRAFPRPERSSSTPLETIVAARATLFSRTSCIASSTDTTSSSAERASSASPNRCARLYRNRSTGRAVEYGTITTPRANASACARRRTSYAASGTAATATGAVRDGSRYCATSRARSATWRSTSRASASRWVGSSAASSASSSATADHLESTGSRRPSGSSSPNSTTRPFTRRSVTSMPGGSCARCSRSTFSPARPFEALPTSTVESRRTISHDSESRSRRSSSRRASASSTRRAPARSERRCSAEPSRAAAASASRRSSAACTSSRASTRVDGVEADLRHVPSTTAPSAAPSTSPSTA